MGGHFDNLASKVEKRYYGTSHIELISSYFIIPRSYLNNFTFCKVRERDQFERVVAAAEFGAVNRFLASLLSILAILVEVQVHVNQIVTHT